MFVNFGLFKITLVKLIRFFGIFLYIVPKDMAEGLIVFEGFCPIPFGNEGLEEENGCYHSN